MNAETEEKEINLLRMRYKNVCYKRLLWNQQRQCVPRARIAISPVMARK